MSDPVEAAKEHILAWATQDDSIIATTISLPFVQYDEHGSFQVYQSKDELFRFSDLDPYKVSTVECELVSSGPTVSIVKIAFHWEYPDSGFSKIGDAVWAFVECDGKTLLKWRQFLGWRET